MYAFAAGITTSMLAGIGIAMALMVMITISALLYRGALGGRKDWAPKWLVSL